MLSPNTYKLLKKRSDDSIVRVKLSKDSGYNGVVVEYCTVDVHDKTADDGTNCTLQYNVVRVPKNKYKNLDDIEKEKFEKVVGDVFIDLLTKSMKTQEPCESCANCPNASCHNKK